LTAGQADPLVVALGPIHTLLKNKYYVDELYARVIVKPILSVATWVYTRVDRATIDGVLHRIGRGALRWAELNRRFDQHIVNGGADRLGDSIKRAGRDLRSLQTGRIQDYLLFALAFTLLVAAVLITLGR
jgi:NADH-quinone oxidoreductase subunit L